MQFDKIPADVYSTSGTNEVDAVPSHPLKGKQQRFARCLSAVIARLMTEQGKANVYEVVKYLPDAAGIAPMTAYSAMYGRARPNAYVLYHLAGVLGVTLDWLCTQATRLMDGGGKVQTVRDLFGEANARGRPRGKRPKKPQKRGR